MDDAEVRDLLREAPGETPPASFDVDEVRAASRRARLRRRSALAATSAFAVAALAGAGVFGIMMATDGTESTAASSQAGHGSPDSEQEKAAPGQPGIAGKHPLGTTSEEVFPGQPPKQGGDGSAKSGPRADSTDGCDKVDRKLANALADELPATGSEVEPVCASDGHAVDFQLDGGKLTATFVTKQLPDSYAGPPGPVTVTRQTPDGGSVLIMSIPKAESGSAPLAGELERIASELAARF